MDSLQDLEQLAEHLRFKIKRALYQDYFFDADKYEAELSTVMAEIEEIKANDKNKK